MSLAAAQYPALTMPPFPFDHRSSARFDTFEVHGHCLGRTAPTGWFMVSDSHAEIRFGDIVAMEGAGVEGREGAAKIFVGRTDEDTIEVVMLDPVEVFQIKLRKLYFAHRVRCIARRRWTAALLRARIALCPSAHTDRLGLIAAKTEGKEIKCQPQ